MKTSQGLIIEILDEFGLKPRPIVGGAEQKHVQRQIPQERYERLLHDLKSVQKRSRLMANLVTIAHFFVLFIVAIVAWMNQTDTTFLVGILATGTGIFALLLGKLREFWQDTVSVDLLVAVLPDLNSDDKIKMLLAILHMGRPTKK